MHAHRRTPETRALAEAPADSSAKVSGDQGISETGVPWALLEVGQTVEVESKRRIRGIGTVDAVMTDGSVIWLQMHNGHGRILLAASDSDHLRPIYDEMPKR